MRRTDLTCTPQCDESPGIAQADRLQQLAQLVCDGDDRAVLPLWESVRRFVHQKAHQALLVSGGHGGIELDDLVQVGFLATLKAAAAFDPERGSFLSYLTFHLRKEFARAGGYLTSRQDALDKALSLDAPISSADGDESDTTYGDMVSNETAVSAFEGVEDAVYAGQLHDVLDAELDRLSPQKADAIRGVYWRGKTQTKIAERRGVSCQAVGVDLRRGLETLRRGSSARRLREFLDDAVDLYSGNGLASFRQRGSAVEVAVIVREELAEEWQEERES